MKQTRHNEVDLLLRSLARGGKSGSVTGAGEAAGETPAFPALEDQPVTEHMDADEISSYAERTLPDAARARYTAHLSDCKSCRKIVATLVDASGISVSKQAGEQFDRVSFWHQLTAFFSPQVLRFAIPALAILAVVGVGLFALRDRRQAEFVAQNQPSTSTSAPTFSGRVGASPQQENLSDGRSKAKSGEGSDVASPHAEKKTASETKQEESKTSDSVSDSAALAKDAPGVKSSAGVAGGVQPTFAPEPAAPPPPKLESVTVARRAENVVREREAAAERDERVRQQDEQARTKNETYQAQSSQSKPQAARPLGGVGTGSRSGEAKRSDASADRSNEESEATRTVSGRRFRRQGSAWVDAAYDASQAVTKISRGSEQYRALLADEPGIRMIAEQLQGEVVLVWKGRAYRIR